ncbi:MAG: metallophosphoesterase [Victivallaceae bacterium]
MSTVIFGMDFGREKFKDRASEWQRKCSYPERRVFRRGEYVDIVEYEIPAATAAVRGRKILWFSDLHFRGCMETEALVIAESSEFINELAPEYIVYGGDIVTYSSGLPLVRTFLQSLPEKAGKIAILGNWEYGKRWLKPKDWEKFFASAGFRLLVNKAWSSDDVFFYGVDELRRGYPAPPENIPANKQAVILAHSPDAFIHISDRDTLSRSNLVLCGHTHGGQVRVPFLGALLTSSRYWRKFDYGLFENSQSGSHMIVSAGLGCSTIQVRIACRRELVLVNMV